MHKRYPWKNYSWEISYIFKFLRMIYFMKMIIISAGFYLTPKYQNKFDILNTWRQNKFDCKISDRKNNIKLSENNTKILENNQLIFPLLHIDFVPKNATQKELCRDQWEAELPKRGPQFFILTAGHDHDTGVESLWGSLQVLPSSTPHQF